MLVFFQIHFINTDICRKCDRLTEICRIIVIIMQIATASIANNTLSFIYLFVFLLCEKTKIRSQKIGLINNNNPRHCALFWNLFILSIRIVFSIPFLLKQLITRQRSRIWLTDCSHSFTYTAEQTRLHFFFLRITVLCYS